MFQIKTLFEFWFICLNTVHESHQIIILCTNYDIMHRAGKTETPINLNWPLGASTV